MQAKCSVNFGRDIPQWTTKHFTNLSDPMLGQVDVEVDRGVEDGEQVRDLAGLVDPGWPVHHQLDIMSKKPDSSKPPYRISPSLLQFPQVWYPPHTVA